MALKEMEVGTNPQGLVQDNIAAEPQLLQSLQKIYWQVSWEQFAEKGYAHFAKTVEDCRSKLVPIPDEPLNRPSMDQLWARVVMDFCLREAWRSGEDNIEGICLALLDREDGKGVEDMWEQKHLIYPTLDINLYHPVVGHGGLFEDYLKLGVRVNIDIDIRSYLEKTENNTDWIPTDLRTAALGLKLIRHRARGSTASKATVGPEKPDDSSDSSVDELRKVLSSLNLTELAQSGTVDVQLGSLEKSNACTANTTSGRGDNIANADLAKYANDSDINESVGVPKTPDLSAQKAIDGLSEPISPLDLTESANRDISDALMDDLRRAIARFTLAETSPSPTAHAQADFDISTRKIARATGYQRFATPRSIMRCSVDDEMDIDTESYQSVPNTKKKRAQSLPNLKRKRSIPEDNEDYMDSKHRRVASK